MTEIQEYKCPNCGGAISFDSHAQKMKCPYCDAEFEVEALKSYDDALKEDVNDQEEMVWDTQAGGEWSQEEKDKISIYTCKSCAGEIVGDDTLASTSCPYCGNPVVFMGKFSGELRPDYVIPFKLDKQAAMDGLKKHIQGKILLPKAFQTQNHIEEIKGIYVPFWLFDADVQANMRYRATKVRTWSDSNYNYRETQHYSITRNGRVAFENVAIDGSTKMEDDLMESINPYTFKDAVDFQTAYLAGYLADKYDVTADDSIDRANERVKQSTEDVFRKTVHGYSTVTREHAGIHLSNGEAKYALYPVWFLSTIYAGKKYVFAMNGQTGKFVGDLPMDQGKFWMWTIGLFAGITILGTLMMFVM